MQNNKNVIIFLVLSFLLIVGWMELQRFFAPPKPKPEPVEQQKGVQADRKAKDAEQPREQPTEADIAAEHVAWAAGGVAREAMRARRPRIPPQIIHLGSPNDNLRAELDPRGAAVRRVVLNKFQQGDISGNPEWEQLQPKVPTPLELVRKDLNEETGSYLLYQLDPDRTRKGNFDPLPALGQMDWTVIEADKVGPGQIVRRVVFEAQIDGWRITKIFTLQPEDYHIGLEVQIERLAGEGGDKPRPFSYQLTSAHGLRIEGEWYSTVLRNALIGYRDVAKDIFLRKLDDARSISAHLGSDPVEVLDNDKEIRYAGIVVQYFGSMVVVDDEQVKQDFLARARATREGAAVKGRVKSVSAEERSFVLTGRDGVDYSFRLAPALLPSLLREKMSLAVVYTQDENDQLIATSLRPEEMTEPLFFNDIVARVTSKPIELKAGDPPVKHRYLLYNGPVKVRLLDQLEGDKAVAPELVERYEYRLHLNTMTDYHFPGWGGEFANKIYLTEIIIKFTNLMHSILWGMHTYIMPWSWGLCIIMLTVLVRGMMFPVSRKQAMTSIKMQELAPELKKLQEKYKGDRQAMAQAQMELYRKQGVNPLGSCWLLLLQMPIFMGLYYALQESIHFRLAPFWPWVHNLAAPDMLFRWGEQIPWISRPADYGSFIYLGPYFNLLPVIAVALMIVQQSLMAPPALDEQQAMQMKMMKYMSVIFGLIFYKVAAGLCIYFIASSLWGFAERRLLPKRKPAPGTPPAEAQGGFFHRLRRRLVDFRATQPLAASAATAGQTVAAGSVGTEARMGGGASSRRREKRGKRKAGRVDGDGVGSGGNLGATPDGDGVAGKMRSWWTGLREWWSEILKQAEKK